MLTIILNEKKNMKKYQSKVDIVDILLYFTIEAILPIFQKEEEKLKSNLS